MTARTADSLVVVCSGQAWLVYRGVWLADASGITIDRVEVVGRDYVATNSTVQHRVSTTELTIRSANSILTQLPFVEYRDGTPSADVPVATSLRPTTIRETAAQQPSSSPQQQDTRGQCAYNGYDEFDSYGEYSGRFKCVVFNVCSDECRRLVEKSGTEKGRTRIQVRCFEEAATGNRENRLVAARIQVKNLRRLRQYGQETHHPENSFYFDLDQRLHCADTEQTVTDLVAFAKSFGPREDRESPGPATPPFIRCEFYLASVCWPAGAIRSRYWILGGEKWAHCW